MSLTQDEITRIECLTWDLLSDFYGDSEVIPPIDLNKFIKKSGLSIRQGEFKDKNIEGAFDRSNKVIYIASNSSLVRQIFTAAHEVGHFYLHDNKTEIYRRSDMQKIDEETRPLEQQANWFAASLLMPKNIIIKLWELTQDMQEIAKRCGVSSLAVYYRLKNLGLINE